MLYHRPAHDNQSLSVTMFSVSGYVFGLSVMTVPKAASHQRVEPRIQCDNLNGFFFSEYILQLKYYIWFMPSLL